jgi:alpha-glucosidase
MSEYLPWNNDSLKIKAEGEEYARFIVKNLKPFIDSHYRTLPDRDNTAIMGSSMGGLISMYIALQYPEVFGKAAIYSPSFWIAPKSFEQIDNYKSKKTQKIYMLAGGFEGDNMVRLFKVAEEKLKNVGFNEYTLKTFIDSTGNHNEQFWGKEFGNTIRYMFNL